MKKIMIFSLLSLVSWAIAEKFDQVNIENAREITYKITIRHDEKYDKARWEELVKNTIDVVKKMETGGRSGSEEKIIRGLSEAIEMVCLETVKGNVGIHGEMKISVSDGVKEVKKCGDACPCISKYKGVCPCTTENNCSSPAQIRAACSAACQKTGCDATKCAQNGCVKSCNK